MKGLMVMCGSRMFINIRGDPIIMEDGFGTLSVDGHGAPMNPGDGVFPITAGGIGGLAWDGTGSRPADGGLHGCIGIMERIISAGVL